MDGLGPVLDLVPPAGLVLRAGADLRGGHAVLAKVLHNRRRTGGTVSLDVGSVLVQMMDKLSLPSVK